MRASSLAALLVVGCTVDAALPPGAQVLCTTDAACAPGFVCPETLGRCVAASGDQRAPSLGDARVEPPFARAGVTAHARFVVDEALGIAATVSAVGPGTIVFAPEASADPAGPAVDHAGLVRDDTPEGTYALAARLVDASGNVADGVPVGTLVVDRTPPSIVDGSLRFSVAHAATAVPVGALGPAGLAETEALIDEPLGAPPVVRSEPALDYLQVTEVSFDGQLLHATLGVALPAAGDDVGDIVVDVVADVVDRAGNPATVLLGTVRVDRRAPLAPDVDGDCLTFVRRPWGADETSGALLSTLTLAAACAMPESVGTVLVRAADGSILLHTQAVTDSRFPDVALAVTDAATLQVQFVDDAGNASSPVLVRNIEWVATLGGKVRGSPFPNPHRVDARPVHTASLVQLGSFEQEAEAAGFRDQNALEVEGRAFWVQRTVGSPTNVALVAQYDGGRGRVLGFGSADLFEWTGHRWAPLAITDPEGDGSPVDLGFSGLAHDEARDRMVVFAGQGLVQDQTWTWDGASFRRIAEGQGCEASVRFGASLEWHPGLRRVVLVGGTSFAVDDRALMLGDDDCWFPMTGDVPAGAAPSDGRFAVGLVRDDAHGRIVLVGGTSGPTALRDAWEHDGTQWRQLDDGPPAASLAMMAADPDRPDRVLVAAGGEFWALDDDTWQSLGPPVPSNLFDSLGPGAATVDRARNVMVFVGTGGATWERRGGEFIQEHQQPTGPAEPIEVSRIGSAGIDTPFGLFVVDEALNVDDVLVSRTLLWLNDAWLEAAPGPVPIVRNPVLFNAGGRPVVFGGDAGGVPVDTTSFGVGSPMTWVPQPVTGPPARCCAAVAFDGADTVVMFGGFGAPVGGVRPALGDTWLWRTSTEQWTAGPVGGPPPRTRAAMIALPGPAPQQLLLVGGLSGSFTIIDDTWLWDGAGWQDITPADSADRVVRPSARLAIDPQTGRVTLFGSEGSDVGSVKQWDGARWVQRDAVDVEGNGLPLPRDVPVIGREIGADRVLLTGGSTSSILNEVAINDGVWSWDAGARDHPAMLVDFDLVAAQIPPGAAVRQVVVNATAAGEGDATVGARISWWRAGRWEELGAHAATGLAPLSATITDAEVIRTLRAHRSGHVFLVVEPTSENGVDGARVSLDSVELRVSYQRP